MPPEGHGVAQLQKGDVLADKSCNGLSINRVARLHGEPTPTLSADE